MRPLRHSFFTAKQLFIHRNSAGKSLQTSRMAVSDLDCVDRRLVLIAYSWWMLTILSALVAGEGSCEQPLSDITYRQPQY
jgi:hypothetical protein